MNFFAGKRKLVVGVVAILAVTMMTLVSVIASHGNHSDTVSPAKSVAPGVPQAAVDSFAPEAMYPLSRWMIDETRTAGWVDILTVSPGGDRQVNRDDQSLMVSGWAGEEQLGIRTSRVVFSLCDTVIGTALVNQTRQDVTEKVHPNLIASGWQARLLVGHLPRCEGSILEAWAVGPGGSNLFPLNGRIPTSLSPRTPELSLSHFTPSVPALPQLVPVNQIIRFHTDQAIEMKRAYGDQYASISQLQPGIYTGSLIDEHADWLLVIVNGWGGWINKNVLLDIKR